MFWCVIIFGAIIGIICAMAVDNMFYAQQQKLEERKNDRK